MTRDRRSWRFSGTLADPGEPDHGSLRSPWRRVRQLRGPQVSTCAWWSRRSRKAATAAVSPRSLPSVSPRHLGILEPRRYLPAAARGPRTRGRRFAEAGGDAVEHSHRTWALALWPGLACPRMAGFEMSTGDQAPLVALLLGPPHQPRFHPDQPGGACLVEQIGDARSASRSRSRAKPSRSDVRRGARPVGSGGLRRSLPPSVRSTAERVKSSASADGTRSCDASARRRGGGAAT